ncbi:MAG TPA: hypothetical protein VGK50_08885 [Coriobacteriia bacterium]|jgi:hypothetical protein
MAGEPQAELPSVEAVSTGPTALELQRQVRVLRWWVAVLGIALGVLLLAAVWVGGFMYSEFAGMSGDEGPAVAPEDIAATQQEFKQALGDDLLRFPNSNGGHPPTALVFFEDPKTKIFTFLGTDNSGNWTQW